MAEQADGSIIIDTEIDAKGFKAGSSELQNSIKSLNTKMDSLGLTFQKAISGNASAVETFNAKATTLEKTISDIGAKMESLEKTRVPTKEYTTLIELADKYGYKLDALYAQQKKMEATGVSKKSQAWRSLQYEIERAGTLMEEYNAHANALEEDGKAFQFGYQTDEYAKLKANLDAAKEKLAEMKAQAESTGKSTNKFTLILGNCKKVLSTLGKIGIAAFRKLCSGIKTGILKLKNFGKAVSGGCVATVGKLGKKINGLGSIIKRMAIRKLIMGMFTGVKEGLNNLAQYSSTVNAHISTLKSALTKLKNSLATAFAPVLTIITPALATLINYLSAAITYVGKFIAALTGAKTFTKATAVQEDYAESLGNTGAAAEKAKNQLAGFDELNVLSDSSSRSGGGGTGGVSPSEMFEEVPIESSITDFVDRLKAAFKDGDYGEIGRIIGNGINTALQKINDFISWDNVGDTVTKVVTGIADGFNALFETVDWELLGDTFAEGFNTVLHTIHLIITKFDWLNVAASLTRSLNSFIANVDWDTIGKTISDSFLTALGFIHTALTTFDWRTFGEKIGTLIANIDWKGIFKTILDIVGDIFSGVREFRQGLLSAFPDDLRSIVRLVETIGTGFAAWKIASSVMSAINSIVKLPASLNIGVSLAITGITVGVKGITDALQDGLNGINFAEIIGGGALGGVGIGTLIGGAGGGPLGAAIGALVGLLVSSVIDIVQNWDYVVSYFDGVFDSLGGLFTGFITGDWTGFWEGADQVAESFFSADTLTTKFYKWIVGEDTWQEITDYFKNGGGLETVFYTISEKIHEKWDEFIEWLKKKPQEIGSTIEEFFTSLPNKISGWFSDLWQPIKDFDWYGLGRDIGQFFGEAFKSGIDFVTVTVPQWFSDLWDSIKSAFINFFTVTLPKFFTETLPQAFNTVVDFVKGVPEKLWNAIKTRWDWFVNIGKCIIDGIWEGLQTVWNKIPEFVGGFVQGFKDALGIHSPSRLFRDVVGLNIGYGIGEGIEASEDSVVDTVTGLANAIAAEANAGEYDIGGIISTARVDGALTGFSDKIVNSFTNLLDRLQAIAEGVTFSVPAMAGSVVPYTVAASANNNSQNGVTEAITASNDELSSVIIQSVTNATTAIVSAIQENNGTTVNLDTNSIATGVIKEINRRTRMTGKSPLTI